MASRWTASDYRRDAAEQTAEWNADWRAEAVAASWDQLPPDDDRPTPAELEEEEWERRRARRLARELEERRQPR